MKLNKLSLSLAITLALGSTFGMAHAETTAAHTKAKTTTVTNTQAKATPAKATTAKTTAKADTKVETKATTAKTETKATEAKPATAEKATENPPTPADPHPSPRPEIRGSGLFRGSHRPYHPQSGRPGGSLSGQADRQILLPPGPGPARGPDPGNPAVHYGGLRPARRKGKPGAQRH